jgi:hypothetical protein
MNRTHLYAVQDIRHWPNGLDEEKHLRPTILQAGVWYSVFFHGNGEMFFCPEHIIDVSSRGTRTIVALPGKRMVRDHGLWGHYTHDWSFPLDTVLRPLTMEEATHQDFHWEKSLANRRERR